MPARITVPGPTRSTKHACPCCGYRTLKGHPPGTAEICKLCAWQDAPVQDPDDDGGANGLSLRSAQRLFREVAALEQEGTELILAALGYIRDPGWRALPQQPTRALPSRWTRLVRWLLCG